MLPIDPPPPRGGGLRRVTEGEERDATRWIPDQPQNAKRLRKRMTLPEIALWLALRGNEAGFRFRRQHAAGR
ncbi:DUF559 domain-containing protein [Sphingomonas sp. Leaf38]|uniref:DUF559 domain-containing protein n=1 Tax=Sphingomonas sp. Leaf38 TaxID=1736217 RepID=UPI0012E12A4F